MKANHSHIAFLLDRSGSMEIIASDTVGGFNAFLAAQRAAPGTGTVTLAQFDTQGYDVLYAMRDLATAPDLRQDQFKPRGGTPLLDSMARLIDETGAALQALPESERPVQVYIVTLTDGMENASSMTVMNRSELLPQSVPHPVMHFPPGVRRPQAPQDHDTRRVLSELIKHQQDVYKWQFVYLGANQDAISVAGGMGIASAASINYVATPQGVRAAYAVSAAAVMRARSTGVSGQSVCFTDDERSSAMDDGNT